ncbi:putative conserved lipoprotein LpqG [Actinoplanes teichomyceticus]|nr:putative conserved lipoprotein LpqG [Actinoplanes teichomyceticus]
MPVMLAAVVALSSGLLDGRPAAASTSAAADCPSTAQSRGSVLVTGTGVVYGEPDTLIANFAAETTAATVGEALESANTAATRMRDTLVGGGVARADLQTSNVNISAKQNDKGQITGYTVNQGLTAKIRKLAGAGALMSATVAAGGDAARLNGVSFTIENDAALLAEARRKAFADARGKAALYAGQAGRPLGRVIRVSEVPLSCGYFDNQDRMAAAYSPVPIEPGRQQLAVTVTVEWALGSLPPSSLG